jgi:uncharacterized protein with ATP-grasp and redox domains
VRTSLDCLSCLIRQTVEASRFVSADPTLHEHVMRDVLRMAAELDLSQAPPVLTQQVQRRIRQLTRVDDPYRELKRRANEAALAALPALAAEVRSARDSLTAALRLAIAGNTMDVGSSGAGSIERIGRELSVAYERPFHGDVDAFRHAVGGARKILFLVDNTGEIVIDRLLAEQLPLEHVTFAVRGAPVLNDATRVDATFAGLDRLAEVIDNGSDAPGTVLEDCSAEFRRRFAAADLIVAKGQGNYETLSEEPRDIFFLFAVKCDVVAQRVGLPRGTQVLLRSPAENSATSHPDASAATKPESARLWTLQEPRYGQQPRRAGATRPQHPTRGDDNGRRQ